MINWRIISTLVSENLFDNLTTYIIFWYDISFMFFNERKNSHFCQKMYSKQVIFFLTLLRFVDKCHFTSNLQLGAKMIRQYYSRLVEKKQKLTSKKNGYFSQQSTINKCIYLQEWVKRKIQRYFVKKIKIKIKICSNFFKHSVC